MADKPPSFPAVIPGGALVPHLSARHRTMLIDSLFEAVGGFDRAQAWIEKSDANFEEFFKIWAKGAVRATNVEHNANGDLADMIKRLDQEDRIAKATIIEGNVTEVSGE